VKPGFEERNNSMAKGKLAHLPIERLQDKAGFPASGTSFLRFCLHIVFTARGTIQTVERGGAFSLF
jgi:hypothetical protein